MRFGRRRGRSQRRGIPFRLLLAVGLVVFSVISYYATGEKNPITGDVQRVAISPKQEVALGLRAAPQMTRRHGGLHPDRRAQQHVDDVGEKLLVGLEKILAEKDGRNPFRFEFHLLNDSKTVNAFALPGGQVFITAALFQSLKTEGQLAGVLGHEMGHVLMRHGAQRLAKQKLTQGLVGAAGVAGGSADSARMAAAVGQMVNMKYGRENELESDRWGVLLTAEAGYDPRAMLGVMEILEKASGGGGPPEMLSTHPKPANRQAYIESVLKDVFPDGAPQGLTP